MNWDELVRPEIKSLNAYKSARSLVDKSDDYLYLDANEAPDDERLKWNRYPEPQPLKLLKRMSELFGVEKNYIQMGRGSDESIDILVRSLCEAQKDSILIFPPTYGMYKVSADIQGARVNEVPIKWDGQNWNLDQSAIEEVILKEAKKLKIIFICNPNNPTGNLFELDEILSLSQKAPDSLIVVDEAYIDFSKSMSAVSLLKFQSNIVVLRTFSKAWGLAGLRVGVILANPNLIELLQKVRAPYPMPGPIVSAMVNEIDYDREWAMKKRVLDIVREKDKLSRSLKKLQVVESVFESNANFILARFKNSKEVQKKLFAKGIVVRNRSSDVSLDSCLRITVGSNLENERLLKELKTLS